MCGTHYPLFFTTLLYRFLGNLIHRVIILEKFYPLSYKWFEIELTLWSILLDSDHHHVFQNLISERDDDRRYLIDHLLTELYRWSNRLIVQVTVPLLTSKYETKGSWYYIEKSELSVFPVLAFSLHFSFLCHRLGMEDGLSDLNL